jgi:hypothetical protein
MSKQIIVQAPPGLSLDLDYDDAVIRVVPTQSKQDDFLVIAPKPEQAKAKPEATTASPGRKYPTPPIIMGFRNRDDLAAVLEGLPGWNTRHLPQSPDPLNLADFAEELAAMGEDEIHVIVFKADHGG